MMKTKILDFIDFEKVNTLLEGFNQSTGFVTAILDLDGNVLSKSGWRQICTDFHRAHPETSKRCTISDTVLAGEMEKGENYHFYKCLNGLVDVAVPIIIKGEHIANLFSGQFFFEKPDHIFFKKQAAQFSLNETEYIKALGDVPILSEEKVKIIMKFLLNMTQLISDMTFQRMELIALNQTLKDSEETYRMLYDSLNDALFTTELNEDGSLSNFILVNDIACKRLGYTREELLYKTPADISSEKAKLLLPSKIQKMLDQKHVVVETEHVTKGGKIIPVELSTNVSSYNGKTCFHSVARDITERKQAEEARQMFVMLADSSSEFIGMCDLELKPIYVNPAGIRMVGLPDLAAACQVNVQDYFFPEDQRFIAEEFFPRVLQKGEDIVEIRLRHFQTGQPIWMLYNLFSVRNANCEIVGWATVSRDITDRKQAELSIKEKTEEIEAQNEEYLQINEELNQINSELHIAKEHAEESEINLKAILSSTNDIIATYDLNICFLTFNKACSNIYRELFGIEIYLGLCTLDLFPESMRAFWVLNNSRVLAGETFATEFSLPTANGERFFEQYYNPIDIDGKVVCFSTFTRDITERKHLEFELIAAKEHAEESDRLKTAFLQNMSHEIRTPMNAIMGFSDILLENADNKIKLKNFTNIISQRCNDLLDILNDILDISKIESGQLPLNLEETNLNEVFVELSTFFKEYQKRVDKQHIKFILQPSYFTEENLILTDKVKLKQIFINLISNAFKFTDKGTIECGCKFDENHNLLFYVSDTGAGIPADKHQIVFERFVQLQQGLKRNIGGTGLGLSIVKALVNLLGGKVFLKSEPGEGSTFSFTIPYKPSQLLLHQTSIVETITNGNFIGKTILVVEDDYYNAEYIREILSAIGLNILQAENGKQAIEISQSKPIDLILMDIRLPDIDGYEVTRQILKYKTYSKIVAQTAYAAHDEKQKALDAGCVDYISKPTKREVLLSLLNKHIKDQ